MKNEMYNSLNNDNGEGKKMAQSGINKWSLTGKDFYQETNRRVKMFYMQEICFQYSYTCIHVKNNNTKKYIQY